MHIQLTVGERFFDFISKKRRKSPGEVVMVIRRPGGKVLLHTKDFYPNGVFRLPSGTMKRGELPEESFKRELCEETGFDVGIDRILGTVHFMFEYGDKRVDYFSYIILSNEAVGEPKPEDGDEGITEYLEIDPCDLGNIAEQLRCLTGDWSDWGRFRAPAHEITQKDICSPDQD